MSDGVTVRPGPTALPAFPPSATRRLSAGRGERSRL